MQINIKNLLEEMAIKKVTYLGSVNKDHGTEKYNPENDRSIFGIEDDCVGKYCAYADKDGRLIPTAGFKVNKNIKMQKQFHPLDDLHANNPKSVQHDGLINSLVTFKNKGIGGNGKIHKRVYHDNLDHVDYKNFYNLNDRFKHLKPSIESVGVKEAMNNLTELTTNSFNPMSSIPENKRKFLPRTIANQMMNGYIHGALKK